MKHYNRSYKKALVLALACFLLLCAFPCTALAASHQETVRVGFFAFDGYHMVDENGNRSGYGYDLLQHMVGYTNWKYEYIGYDKNWNEMQDMLENNEIDLLTSAQKTEERLQRFDFSDEPVGTSSAILTVRSGNETYMLKDYTHWSGMRIGLLEGNSRNEDLAEFAAEKGFTYTPIYFDTTSALVEALQTGETIDAAVTSNLRSVENESILAKFAPSPFYIMVKKGNTALLDQINQTLDLLYCDHPDLQTELMDNYYSSESGDEIAFTAEERQFIKEMKDTAFTAFVNPDRVPLSYFENGQATGIIGEIASEISNRTGLNINIKALDNREEYLSLLGSKDADICFDFIHDYSTAEKYGYHLTAPYIDAGISMLYLKSNTERQKAGFVMGSYINAGVGEKIQSDYDELKYYDSTTALTKAIEHGDCDVGYLYTRVCERIVLNDPRNRLASEWVYSSNVSFCIAIDADSDPRLFSILDKAAVSLSDDLVDSIIRKYSTYEPAADSFIKFIYDNPFVFVSFVAVLFALLILAAFIVLIIRKRRQDAVYLAEANEHNALLSDALTAAKAASEAKNSFLSQMSHEMRTPLNAVIGFMELAKDATPAQRNTYRENALAAAKQLLSIINDVLDMSAISTGKLKISSMPFDLKQVIQSITNIYAAQCEAKGIELQVVLETPVDEQLVGDALRLNQILMNLLSNAVKFTEHGFVRLAVSQRNLEKRQALFCFKITDSGCGMSADMLARIGKPFEQENADIARKHGGSGLGLSIVKTLAAMMNGALKVESTEGIGSTFTVNLPFMKSDSQTDTRLPKDAKDLYVLAVDDQASECDYLSMVLSRIQVRHSCVKNGKDALLALQQARKAGDSYNICLVDWKMPDMDGIILTRHIRDTYSKNMIVIVISAYEHQQDMELAAEAGADLFVSKPLLQSSLLDLFMTITNGRIIKPQPVKKQHDFSGRRILLAEDNAMNKVVAEALLKKLGICCETANDGKIALDMFTASPSGYYDGILMDIQMPNMDGYEAAGAIRASDHPDAKHIEIIALSANAFHEDVAKSISVGMNDHLTKPIDMEQLADALDRAFSKKRK